MTSCTRPLLGRRQVLAWGAAGWLAGQHAHLMAQDQAQAANMPASIADALGTPLRAGSSLFRFWGLEVYEASLWITPDFKASSYWQTPFALALNYRRSLDGGAIAKRSLEEMQRAGSLSPAQGSEWLAAMARLFPNVKKDDTLTGVHLPRRGARFLINGRPLGEVTDPDFSRRFFGIWLDTATSAPDLRTALLAGTSP